MIGFLPYLGVATSTELKLRRESGAEAPHGLCADRPLSRYFLAPKGQSIANDARLQKAVAITELARSAPAVCADLGQLTGVEIVCDPYLRDDLLVLSVHHRSAADVMARIASEFGWRWRPTDRGYRLEPTDAFRKKAEGGRDRFFLQQGLEVQTKVKGLLARKPRDLTYEGTTLFALPEFKSAIPTLDRIFLDAYAHLSPEQLGRLHDERLVLATQPKPLEVDLKGLGEDQEFDTAALEGRRMCVELRDLSSGAYYLLDEKGRVLIEGGPTLPRPEERRVEPLPDELRRALLAAKNGEQPDATSPEELERFAKSLVQAADKCHCDLLSDAYDDYDNYWQGKHYQLGKLAFIDPDLLENDTHENQLSEALIHGFSPRIEQNWVINRNVWWPRWREEQVPRALLDHIKAPIPLMPLDSQLEAASRFSLAQTQSPLFPFNTDAYYFARFWMALPSEVKTRLTGKDRIPLWGLPEQTVGLLYEINEPSEVTLVPSLDGDTTPVAMTSDMNPKLLDFAELYPNRVDANAYVWLQMTTRLEVYDEDKGQLLDTDEFDVTPSQNGNPVRGSKHIYLAYTSQLSFRFELGNGLETSVAMRESKRADPIPLDRSRWPKALKDAIAESQAEFDRIAASISSTAKVAKPPP